VGSAARARELLGWQPKYPSIDSILQTAWAWHVQRDSGKEIVTSRTT